LNILFVHETEYIEKVVFEYQIIPEIFASQGHNIIVIDFPTLWKKRSFFDFGSLKAESKKDISKANKAKGITLIRPGIIKIPIISRLVAFIAYFFLIKKVIKQYKIEKIVLYSVPTNGFQTLYWSKKYKIPVHFRLLDVLHQLVPNKILSGPTYIMEKLLYRRVSSMTAITPRLTKYAIRMGADPNTTSYLPSGSDLDIFYPTEKDPNLARKYNILKDDQVILFAGTLFYFSGLDILINFLIDHPNEQKNKKFLIVGHGEQYQFLKKMIKENNLSDVVVLTGFINYIELPKYINLADVCINPFEINQITDIIFPGKIYQYMACEKPVIATRLSEVIDIFPDNSKNESIRYFNLRKPQEFFSLLKIVGKKRIKDVNPSLQEIADNILNKLKLL
jgi:glycosyltransferase involved in cell wall biosynthesis